MKDRIPGMPGQVKGRITQAQLVKMQNGEAFTMTLQRDDQPAEVGTPYSKAAVLPDTLAGLICPETTDPTPADAFNGLQRRVSHPNLLDNSDFSNPVNQRRQEIYNVKGYTIDRWTSANTAMRVQLDSGQKAITLSNTGSVSIGFTQYIDPENMIATGTELTMAVMIYDPDRNENRVLCGAITLEDDWTNGYAVATRDAALGLALRFYNDLTTYRSQMFTIMLPVNTTVQLLWAALYQGAYTTETLPVYCPKGYAAELAVCRRYFRSLSGAQLPVVVAYGGGSGECHIPVSNDMRIIPTLSKVNPQEETNLVSIEGATVNPTGLEVGRALNGDITVLITGDFAGYDDCVGMWFTDSYLSADV